MIASATLMVIGVGFALIHHFVSKSHRSDAAAEAYLSTCRQEHPEAECRARLDANHEECFFINDVPGGRSSRGYFRDQQYEACVAMGVEAWQDNRRADRRARERERERLKLPR